MPAIGHVALQGDGRFRGTLATVTLRAPIEIVPTIGKTGDTQPDYRVIDLEESRAAPPPLPTGHKLRRAHLLSSR